VPWVHVSGEIWGNQGKSGQNGTKALLYANTVWGSGPLIEARLLEDPGLYPPRETMSKLSIQPPLSADVEAELNRIWAKLKKG
jgi:putrescine transport system substrate-binding protein